MILQLETSFGSTIYFLKLSWVFNFLNFKLLFVQYLQKMWIVTTALKFFFNPLLRQLIKFLQSKYFPSNAVKTNDWLIFRNPITLNRYLLSIYENRDWIMFWGYKNRSIHARHLQNPAEKNGGFVGKGKWAHCDYCHKTNALTCTINQVTIIWPIAESP